MVDFFKPWRRKLGVVVLLMACVLMAGWVRSWRVDNVLMLPAEDDNGICILINSYEGLLSIQIESIAPRRIKWGVPRWLIIKLHRIAPVDDPMIWKFRFCGFAAGYELCAANAQYERVDLWIAPYWSVVLPLAILSAWLLLSKPQKLPTVSSKENV